MRVSNRSYTLIIAGHADATLWRLSLSYPVLLAIAFFVLLGLITAGVGSYRCGRMILRVKDYKRLLAENGFFRIENHEFRVRTAQLGEKLDFLETLAHRLSIITGMNSEKTVGGVGGFSAESYREPLPASTATLSSFDRYAKSASALEDQYRRISEVLSGKILLASAMPDRMPVRGLVTGGMGPREDPFNASITEDHGGLDISAPYGSSVYAPADGVVIFAGHGEGYGNLIVIDHKFGIVNRFGHLSRLIVKVGQKLSRSDVIGYVGTTGRTTGPHLHYEVWLHNVRKDPGKYFSHSESE